MKQIKYAVSGKNGFLAALLISALAVMLTMAAVSWYVQHTIYMPSSDIRATPADVNLACEDVYLNTADGIKLNGWYVPAKNAQLTVLFCHGNGGNMSRYLSTVEFLNDCGVNVFIFDYRGYGQSKGTPTEKGTYLDAQTAWDWLLSQKHIEPNNIVIFGRSLGASVAAELASNVQPAGLWIESAFTTILDEGAITFPRWLVKLACSYRYPTVDYIRKVHCPVLVVHSTEDHFIPYKFGQELYAAANEPKTFIKITGNHYNGFHTSGTAYTIPVCEWLSRLNKSPKTSFSAR